MAITVHKDDHAQDHVTASSLLLQLQYLHYTRILQSQGFCVPTGSVHDGTEAILTEACNTADSLFTLVKMPQLACKAICLPSAEDRK